MAGAGNFVVTWTSFGQNGDNPWESNVYAKTFASNNIYRQATATTQASIVSNTEGTATPLIVTVDSPANHVVGPGAGYDGGTEPPHRRHTAPMQSAGNDPGECSQVRIEVECEAMRAHPMTEMEPHRRHLLVAHPDPRRSGRTRSLDAVPRENPNQHFLNLAEVPVHVLVEPLEVENPVSDQLPRPVPGHIATAIHLHHLYPAGAKPLGVEKQILTPCVLPQGHHRLVLKQEQRVRNRAGVPQVPQARLQTPGLPVGDRIRKRHDPNRRGRSLAGLRN
jgi:hypothetical protein